MPDWVLYHPPTPVGIKSSVNKYHTCRVVTLTVPAASAPVFSSASPVARRTIARPPGSRARSRSTPTRCTPGCSNRRHRPSTRGCTMRRSAPGEAALAPALRPPWHQVGMMRKTFRSNVYLFLVLYVSFLMLCLRLRSDGG